MIEPLTGPKGICYTPYTEYSPEYNYFITSACKNPDLAFKLGDWFMTQEHSRIGRYGEKGVDLSLIRRYVLRIQMHMWKLVLQIQLTVYG